MTQYNADSVQAEINKDRRIKGREARMIHAVLKGREPAPVDPDREIADTILRQLGGRRFAAMTGAKSFLFVKRGVTFTIPRANRSGTRFEVTLNGRDTYDVRLSRWKSRDLEWVTVDSRDGVYEDVLRDVFTAMTGLDCTL